MLRRVGNPGQSDIPISSLLFLEYVPQLHVGAIDRLAVLKPRPELGCGNAFSGLAL
jgi:hypothetical protein